MQHARLFGLTAVRRSAAPCPEHRHLDGPGSRYRAGLQKRPVDFAFGGR